MKIIGIIGGIGPESTISYYRKIISRFRHLTENQAYPEFHLFNIDMTAMLEFIDVKDWQGLTKFLAKRIDALPAVDYVAMASNTPHVVFDKLSGLVKVPLISIVEETCKSLQLHGVGKAGLLGTKSTMSSGFYQQRAAQHGIEILAPDLEDQEYFHYKYMTELVPNNIQKETKKTFIEKVVTWQQKHQLNGIVLGGTELPLLLNPRDFPDFNLYDTTEIHVEAIVRKMF